MASSGNHGAAKAKDLRVLLPFTADSLRIPDELAEEVGAGTEGSAEVLVVGQHNKMWHVKAGWDGDGAFLGRGWPQFADACGVRMGWLLILRHHGHGVLTIKAFDATRCLRDLGTPPPQGDAILSGKDTMRKPQFISLLSPESMKRMLIPAKFVQHYIPKEHMGNCMAVVFGPLGKASSIKLEMEQSDMFFAGGWSQFLSFHAITKDDALLIRYEGEMEFKVKVFIDLDTGFLIESGHHGFGVHSGILQQEEAPSASIHEPTGKTDWASSEGQKKPEGYNDSLTKASKTMSCVYNIGPPAWVKKEINASTIENQLALPASFCKAIGLRRVCKITLKTSPSSTRYWQVGFYPYKNNSYHVRSGWSTFCQENDVKVGDVCTINVIETKLWHVVIERP